MPDINAGMPGLGMLLAAPEGERRENGVTGEKILHSQYSLGFSSCCMNAVDE